MASTVALLHKGCLAIALWVISFLKSKHNGCAVFGPDEPDINQAQFPTEDLSAAPCGLCTEDFPSSAPTSRATGVSNRDFF